MWCKQCRQDVRGVPSTGQDDYRCPRCGTSFRDREAETRTPTKTEAARPKTTARIDDGTAASVGVEPLPEYDGWELEQKLRHVERVLRRDQPDDEQRAASGRQQASRLDPAHAASAGWHYPAVAQAKSARKRTAGDSAAEPWLPMLTWATLALGVMAFVCGGVLLAWSAASGRQELWTIGMPIALGGQIVLLIGLMLQLDRLWHDNRHTAEKLHHVDERLHDLNTATTLLGASHSSASASFYSHFAGGASPQLLLADLKSQLDLLAVKLSQDERHAP